jgi:uroporphyrinogen III methyltransferase/synthase
MSVPGAVYIVGAGPGDPELITVRGLMCLREADVVLHDRLVDRRLLDEARADAEIIDVGKQPGNEDAQQDQINRLMIERARLGKAICRLKSGDPFVFGRGAEEAEALVQAGIPFEIVPGVTSAVAAPAYAGIPVTHRQHAHSFMVITGSRSHDLQSGEWAAARSLVRAGGTVVVLMGLARLSSIMESFIDDGCAASTPVAVVSNGARTDQETSIGTLGSIGKDASAIQGRQGPATIVIGDVVALHEKIRWFDISYKLRSV